MLSLQRKDRTLRQENFRIVWLKCMRLIQQVKGLAIIFKIGKYLCFNRNKLNGKGILTNCLIYGLKGLIMLAAKHVMLDDLLISIQIKEFSFFLPQMIFESLNQLVAFLSFAIFFRH